MGPLSFVPSSFSIPHVCVRRLAPTMPCRCASAYVSRCTSCLLIGGNTTSLHPFRRDPPIGSTGIDWIDTNRGNPGLSQQGLNPTDLLSLETGCEPPTRRTKFVPADVVETCSAGSLLHAHMRWRGRPWKRHGGVLLSSSWKTEGIEDRWRFLALSPRRSRSHQHGHSKTLPRVSTQDAMWILFF